MKRILLSVVFLTFLCGCQKAEPEYLISAMGYDYTGGEYSVCFEAVIINSEDTEQTVKLLEGKGQNIENAVAEIKKKCTQPLLLSHCGVIAVGSDMTKQQLKQVVEYCYDREQITLSALFIETENPQKLLTVKPISSVCVGYEIMGLLKQNTHYNNRFFEVLASNYTAKLPIINHKNGGLYFGS